MFINDFQSSNEYRLHQVLHTLKSMHGTELNLDDREISELESLKESSEIIKNSIVSESRFNTYNSNPEYTKHMLIMEAIRLYLVEIAPKRQRRKVKESVGTEVDEEMINPAQDPTMQKKGPGMQNNKSPLKPGTVNMKNKATGKIDNVPVSQVQNRQNRGDQVVGDEDVRETMDPELAALMQRYGVEPGMEEGNEFSGARQDAIDAGEDKFTVGKKTYRVTGPTNESEDDRYSGGDWGSSDWYAVMKGMDEILSKTNINPDTIKAAAEDQAEFYHDMMGYSVEDATDRIISMWLTRKGFKLEEDDHKVSNPDYHKLAKEHRKAAKAAMDTNDERDFNKHQDLSNYYLVKSGGKAPGHIVDVNRFMKYVEKEYIDQLNLNESANFDHDNYQSSMARSELYRNTKYAMDMLKIIKPGDEVQPWIAANLTKASDYLDKVYHYLDYYNTFEPEQLPEDDGSDGAGKALGESTGSIARMNLTQIVEYSTKLFSMIQPGDKLEGWVAMKLTTASDCISSSKHYMEYQQFEKHAHDMLDDVNGMAEEGAKMKKKSVKESVGQMLMSMMLREDQDLAQAQTLLAAKALSDDLQDMAEKVAKMSVEDLMPLVDTMKEQFGLEAAEGYNEMMKTSLEALLKSVTDSKDTSDNAILQLQGGGVPSAAGEQEPQPEVTPAADDEMAPADDMDVDAGEIEAPELPEEPLGRAKKDESISNNGKALNEKWDTEMKTKEKDKGMWDGWTISELKAEKKKLMDKESRSAAEQKKVKQIDFAIRAKQKDKWGKVKKEGVAEAVFPGAQDVAMPRSSATGKKAALQKQYNSLMMDLKNANDARSEAAVIKKIEPVVKQLNALGDHAPMPTRIFKESTVAEKAPPGEKAEEFIKKNKASFRDRYGNRGEEVLYRTAWKKFGPKSESYLKTEKMLESSKDNLARIEQAFEAHKKQFKKMVSEGTVQDPLKTGYGLEGELMVEKIGDLNGMISKLKEMLRAEISRGAKELFVAEHNARKAERLTARKSAAPYGVLWLGEDGSRKGKFFENDKLRKFWLDLNAKEINEHQLVNPEHFDSEIQKLSRKG